MAVNNVNIGRDVYYKADYVDLYAKGDSSIYRFNYEAGNSKFSDIGLLSPIKTVGEVDVRNLNLWDISTPYGYGGPITNDRSPEFIRSAINAYRDECRSKRIVASFIRFHPFGDIREHLRAFMDFDVLNNQTVIIDTTQDKEARWAGYSSRTRGKLRKCARELKVDFEEDIPGFMHMYHSTMERLGAEEFYFFDTEYFEDLMSMPDSVMCRIMLDNRMVNAGIYLVGEDYLYYHLGASDRAESKRNGTYLMMDTMADIAHQKMAKFLYIGGGTSSAEDDSLFRFKKLFSDLTVPFFIGGFVHLQDKYDELNLIWKGQYPNDQRRFFLKYRQ